ncbi:hypothetical protein K2Q08_02300 [Patescibacteria group bacterium]|nr:hypothetical protein [Patescibacteria group bacterium]
MSLGHRHQSLRRRGVIKTSGRSKRLLFSADVLAYCVTFFSLFFTLDQVRIIWIHHDVEEVSFLTWTLYAISSVTWLFYGIVHREKVLILTNSFWIILNSSIVLGLFLYQ